MSKKSKRMLLLFVGVAIVLLAIAQHFGWVAGPPAALAPGIQ
jgi:hypothetical protein